MKHEGQRVGRSEGQRFGRRTLQGAAVDVKLSYKK